MASRIGLAMLSRSERRASLNSKISTWTVSADGEHPDAARKAALRRASCQARSLVFGLPPLLAARQETAVPRMQNWNSRSEASRPGRRATALQFGL